MPSSSLLTDGYLAHYACQIVICAFIATVLAALSRLQPTGLMRWWSVSWAAHATYIACAGLAFYFVLAGAKPTDPSRLLTGALAMTSAVVQIYTLVAGWITERRGVNTWSRARLTKLILCREVHCQPWIYVQLAEHLGCVRHPRRAVHFSYYGSASFGTSADVQVAAAP